MSTDQFNRSVQAKYSPDGQSLHLIGLIMIRRALFASAALSLAPFVATAQMGMQGLPDSTRLAIQRVLSPVSGNDAPGCAVGISRGGRPVYQSGFGAANLETNTPITPGSVFHVASISKQFTAASIMLLVADGKLSLDDDIRKHLPELRSYGPVITIRHLLQHTSGMRDQWSLLALARGRFNENRITDDDVMEIVARQQELNFPTGTQYEYSNTGYTLASQIVKRVSGQSMRAFAESRIFSPLGMSRTHFHDDYTMLVPGRTSAYERRADGWHVSIPNFDTYGATSLFTTTGDLLKWAANLEKPVVGNTAMYDEMRKSGVLTTGEATGYGLGLTSGRYRGAVIYGHGGADAGYRSNLDIVPAHGLAVAVLCNAANGNPGGLSRGIIDVLLRSQLTGNLAPTSPTYRPSTAALDRVAGLWIEELVGRPLLIKRRDSVLVIGTAPNAPALLAFNDTTYTAGPGGTEYRLRANGTLAIRNPGSTLPANSAVKRPEVTLTGAALAPFAGTYYSEELGATYTVTAGDSTLVLKTRWGSPITVRSVTTDHFVGNSLVVFTRDSRGRIDGMRVSDQRSRRVRFVRR